MVLFFRAWLTSVSMTISRSVYVSASGIILFFLWLSNTPLYICTTFSLHIPCWWMFGFLPCRAIVDSAPVSTEVYVFFWIMVFSSYILRSGIERSCCNSIFSFFLRSFFLVFTELVTRLLLYVLVFWSWELWDPSCPTKVKATPLALEGSLTHWTTKKVPIFSF